jgi:hypothetical protein
VCLHYLTLPLLSILISFIGRGGGGQKGGGGGGGVYLIYESFTIDFAAILCVLCVVCCVLYVVCCVLYIVL